MNYAMTVSVGDRCPVCGQGRLLIALSTTPGDMFIICDDCESEWSNPESALKAEHPTRDKYKFSRFAGLDDLDGHSWMKYVT